MANFDAISFAHIKKMVEKYYKEILIAAGCCGAVGVGIYFFMQRDVQMQERAQLAFAQTITETVHAQKDATLWPNVELAAKTGYRDYKSSSLAPYFLIVESQSLLFQGNDKQSLELMENGSKDISKSSPFYYIFKIKGARMKLDNNDSAVQKMGFTELKALAHDTANKQRDEALYYLGSYYNDQNDTMRAQEAWKDLITAYQETSDGAMSPWATLALEKLKK